MSKYLFTSESVTEGHPDKICDQISDAILDSLLSQDPNTRAGIETFATAGVVVVGGEVSTKGYADVQKTVRGLLKHIGYNNPDYGLDYQDVGVLVSLHEQAPEITQGVLKKGGKIGAGDQGLMFGYACDETPELMPLPIMLAHRLAERLAWARKTKKLPYLRPDGKSQVAVEYDNGRPVRLHNVVLAAQHDANISHHRLYGDLIREVVRPVCGKWLDLQTKVFINMTGSFVQGGPEADTGLTGRKIIVDTYGGKAHHGGGCFSGKDPSKVDRSAAYVGRYIAKNIVGAGLAKEIEIQLAYVIGEPEPISLSVNTFNTGRIPETDIIKIIKRHFPLTPKDIITHLKLKKPIYLPTATYGHFGRNLPSFTWEKLDKIKILKKYLD